MWWWAPTVQTRAGARPTRTRNSPWVTFVLARFFGKLVLALPDRTVDHGNAMGFGVSTHATAEPAGQPHQVSVVERLIRSGQRPPPHPEPARIMAHAAIGVQ